MEAKMSLEEKKERKKRARTVAGLVNSIETLEGAGFLVRRPFPKAAFSEVDPFLLLDEMGPMTLLFTCTSRSNPAVALRNPGRRIITPSPTSWTAQAPSVRMANKARTD